DAEGTVVLDTGPRPPTLVFDCIIPVPVNNSILSMVSIREIVRSPNQCLRVLQMQRYAVENPTMNADDVLRTMIGLQILEKSQMVGWHRIEESSIRKGQSFSDKARSQALDFAVKHGCGVGRVTADRRKRLQRQDPDVTRG